MEEMHLKQLGMEHSYSVKPEFDFSLSSGRQKGRPCRCETVLDDDSVDANWNQDISDHGLYSMRTNFGNSLPASCSRNLDNNSSSCQKKNSNGKTNSHRAAADNSVLKGYQELRRKHSDLQKSYDDLDKEHENLRKLYVDLKAKHRSSVVWTRKVEKVVLQQNEAVKAVFNDDQIRALKTKHPRGVKWSEETMLKAFQLLTSCGRAGYSVLLYQKYPIPSLLTLRRWVASAAKEEPLLCTLVEDSIKGVESASIVDCRAADSTNILVTQDS